MRGPDCTPTDNSQRPGKHLALLGRGVAAVAIGTFDQAHREVFCFCRKEAETGAHPVPNRPETNAPSIPTAEAEGFTARFDEFGSMSQICFDCISGSYCQYRLWSMLCATRGRSTHRRSKSGLYSGRDHLWISGSGTWWSVISVTSVTPGDSRRSSVVARSFRRKSSSPILWASMSSASVTS